MIVKTDAADRHSNSPMRRNESYLVSLLSIAVFVAFAIYTTLSAFSQNNAETPSVKGKHSSFLKARGAKNKEFSFQEQSNNQLPNEAQPNGSAAFSTSSSSWSAERVAKYEHDMTPKKDPNKLYMERVNEQFLAETENGHQLVRYLANIANLSKDVYELLIRVQTDPDQVQSVKKRWDPLINDYELQLPSFVRVRVEYITEQSNMINGLFRPSQETADWVLVVQGSTYVNLKRLVQFVFADVDPSLASGKGLLQSGIPIVEAGMLFTHKALLEVSSNPETDSCWPVSSVEEFTACLANNDFSWTSFPGANPFSSRDLVFHALEGSLFTDFDRSYESVGGAITGTAYLPITYGNMAEDELFYHQLAVDTNQGKVPKILHQIWSGPLENIKPEVQDGARECQRVHKEKGWEYMFWDDEKLEQLTGIPKIHLHDMKQDMKLVRMYTDAMRLIILHRYGGVYLDIDSFCLRPFDPLLAHLEEEGKDFLANYESERLRGKQIANGILIAAPASPVLSATALHIGTKMHLRENWKERADFKITGPWATTEVHDQWDSWVRNHQITLSSTAFIPLYKDEGQGLELEDVFDIAMRQGSYTVQMYQHTKGRSMFKLVKQAREQAIGATKTRRDSDKSEKKTTHRKDKSAEQAKSDEDVSIEETKDDNNVSVEETENNGDERTSVEPINDGKAVEPSVLMVVAHFDDELYAGEYLVKEGPKVHVLVTCTKSRETEMRAKEFEDVKAYLGYHGEFLDGRDTATPDGLEKHVQERIETLICENDWDRIITHGPEGEYGHRQHQVLHDVVSATVKKCLGSYENFYVFEPHPSDNNVLSEGMLAATKLYTSQLRVLVDTFGTWKEQLVPFDEYNFEKASNTCLAEAAKAKKAKFRNCRLDKMIDFSSTDAPALQWENFKSEQVESVVPVTKNSVEEKPSVLMIVAHPDDELVWAGEYLVKEGAHVHVVVTCTKGKDTSIRRQEFENVKAFLGYHGEFLDSKDAVASTALEGPTQERIQSLICEKSWDRIITHGPEGEYGHPQHQVVHDAVSALVNKCLGSYEKLYVFEPHISENTVFSETKNAAAELYKSQKRVIFDTFGNWQEQIVPFESYNFESASETCLTAASSAKKSKYRNCRLAKMLDFGSGDSALVQWKDLELKQQEERR